MTTATLECRLTPVGSPEEMRLREQCIRYEAKLTAAQRRIGELEWQLQTAHEAIHFDLDDDAECWRKQLKHRDEWLGPWLIDQAHTDGRQDKYTVDAGLRGEDFIPCSFGSGDCDFALLETVYEIKRRGT